MKIYVVLPDYGYEGLGHPLMAFTDRTAADAEAAKDTDCIVCEVDLIGSLNQEATTLAETETQ